MSMNQNGKFRRKRVNFAQISNTALRDVSLSLKAKGLYSLIQSLITLPDEDGLLIWKISKYCKEGDKAFDSAWKELKEKGYLKQYRIPNGGKNGGFHYEYDLLDTPDISTTTTINLSKDGSVLPPTDTPDHPPQKGGYGVSREPDCSIIEFFSPDDTPENQDSPDFDHIPQKGGNGDDHTPLFAPCAESISCAKHPVPNGGGKNNTPSSNTISGNTSVSQSYEDGLTDFLREKMKVQVEYDYFEDNLPDDLPTLDAIIDYLVEMQTVRTTKINGATQTREALGPYIARVDSQAVMEFMEHMRGKSFKDVKNVSAYWRSCLINFMRDREAQKMTV